MRCRDIMKRDIETVSPEATVQDAAQRMRDAAIGFLPVCDGSKNVVGTVTDRDLTIRVLADGREATTPISDVLTAGCVACGPDDDLGKAEDLMARNQKSRIMCVDSDGHLVGVISLSDIAQREKGGKAAKTLREVSQREARA